MLFPSRPESVPSGPCPAHCGAGQIHVPNIPNDMRKYRVVRRAVLDVGSNTIRLLVGDVADGQISEVLDSSEFVRLGLGVDRNGELKSDRMDAGVAAIEDLAAAARRTAAASLTVVATSAIREASNGPEFVQRVRDETGVQIEIISGEREAELTYTGATLGMSVEGGVVVCDLGGGSAELIYGTPEGRQWDASEPLGSGRLTERFVHGDPPQPSDLLPLTEHVRSVLRSLPGANAGRVVFTGGAASHVALMAGKRGKVVNLSNNELHAVLYMTEQLPSEELQKLYKVRPERARLLAAGSAAVVAIAEFYGGAVIITRQGMREGALLEADLVGA